MKYRLSIYRHFWKYRYRYGEVENIDINIDIDIDKVILENIDIDIDIDKAILKNIDIDKISDRFKFGISNRANQVAKLGNMQNKDFEKKLE